MGGLVVKKVGTAKTWGTKTEFPGISARTKRREFSTRCQIDIRNNVPRHTLPRHKSGGVAQQNVIRLIPIPERLYHRPEQELTSSGGYQRAISSCCSKTFNFFLSRNITDAYRA